MQNYFLHIKVFSKFEIRLQYYYSIYWAIELTSHLNCAKCVSIDIENTPTISSATVTFPDTTPIGTVLGTVTASDVDVGDVITVTMTSPSTVFAFDSSSCTNCFQVCNKSKDLKEHGQWDEAKPIGLWNKKSFLMGFTAL